MDLLTILLIAVVGVFLFFNLYARKRLLSSYKKLQRAGVEFEARHIFNKKLRVREVHSTYPEQKEEVEVFCARIRESIRYAVILFVVIACLGVLIMYLNQ